MGSLVRSFLTENLDLPEASKIEDAIYEPFQINFWDEQSPLRIDNKSRQIAWSWGAAADAIAHAVLFKTSSIFVSINQDEAAEKIIYANDIFENLRGVALPKVVTNNKLNLGFDNGAVLSSLPAKAPRGKARRRVYLDEFAHPLKNLDKAIYQGSLPILSKGGVLRIGSSPFGARGVFWEIWSQKFNKFPGFVRHETPWWEVQAFCHDIWEARQFAPQMSTADRVAKYAKDRLKLIFENMVLEDFQQEYECVFADESRSWITFEELDQVADPDLLYFTAETDGSNVEPILSGIEDLALAIQSRRIRDTKFLFGMDVGRDYDSSELLVLGISKQGLISVRGIFTFRRAPFDTQELILNTCFEMLPLTVGKIDRTSIGRQLSENAEKKWTRAQGVDFTTPSKIEWGTDAKIAIQKKWIAIPVEKELFYQIHSIQRSFSGNNIQFKVDSNEKSNADKFWALAMGITAAIPLRSAGSTVSQPRVGKPRSSILEGKLPPRIPVAPAGLPAMLSKLPPRIGFS